MKNWTEYKLKDVLQFSHGKAINANEQGDYKVYGSNGVIGFSSQFKYERAIIIGRVGAYCGATSFEENKFWASDNAIVANAKSGFDIKYLSYLLKSFPLNEFAGGSAQPLVNQGVLGRITAKIPSFPTQQRIASILSAYDDLIEVNNQRIKLLEETARDLYKEWFVRMRFPGYKKAKFVKGVPEGWAAGCIGDLYSVKSGFAFKGELLGSIGVPIIKITNIQDNGIDIYNCNRYSGEIIKRIEKFELKDGDLLIAMTGAQIGKIGLIAEMSERYFLNQRVGKFFPKKDILTNNAFAYFNSTSEYFRAMIENYAMGAAQPNISGEQIEKIACIVPSDTLLKKFTEICEPIFEQVSILKSQNTQLRQIRDRLLPRLISGKLEVKEIKQHVTA
jgi:type I restriction enzyme S subunit